MIEFFILTYIFGFVTYVDVLFIMFWYEWFMNEWHRDDGKYLGIDFHACLEQALALIKHYDLSIY